MDVAVMEAKLVVDVRWVESSAHEERASGRAGQELLATNQIRQDRRARPRHPPVRRSPRWGGFPIGAVRSRFPGKRHHEELAAREPRDAWFVTLSERHSCCAQCPAADRY